MRNAVAVALAFAAVAFSGCAGDAVRVEGTLAGTVLLGPTCPVQRDPPDPQCADRPYSANLTLDLPDGTWTHVVFRSGANGTFSVAVGPGTYVLRSAESDAPRHPACSTEQPIVVQEHRTTTVAVHCDTGIR